MTLTEVMEQLRADELKAAAKRLGLPKTLTRKADLVQAVGHYVAANLQGFLGQLSDNERLFLAEAAHHGGRVSPRGFAAKHESDVPRGSLSAGNGTEPLTELFACRDQSTGELCIPEDLAQRLKSILPKPPEPVVKTVAQIPSELDFGKSLLGGLSPAAFREGFQRLLADDQFDELNRINHIRGQAGKAKRYMTDPSERRDAICDSMADWPVGRWIPFDEAFRFANACGGELTVTDAPEDLFFCEWQYGSLGNADDGIERQYLRTFFMETLATLGILDIAYVYPQGLWPDLRDSWGTDDLEFCGRYDGLLYVRLSSLGAYCVGVSDAYEPPATEQRSLLKVLANRELALSGSAELSPADRAMLELYAKQSGDHLWRLDPQRILDYVESGGSVTDVTRFLTQNSAEEIPHTVEVFLNDLAGKLDAVRGTERAILVEMKDTETATRVAHDRQTKSLCRLTADRYLAVSEKNEQAFRSAMKKLGYVLPR